MQPIILHNTGSGYKFQLVEATYLKAVDLPLALLSFTTSLRISSMCSSSLSSTAVRIDPVVESSAGCRVESLGEADILT